MILELCLDVRLCQKIFDQFHHVPLVFAHGGSEFESWSVDEHDPLAVQLKLFGRSDFMAQSWPQTRPTSLVDELQLQSLESALDRSDCPPYRGFSRPYNSYHARPKGWPTQTLYGR